MLEMQMKMKMKMKMDTPYMCVHGIQLVRLSLGPETSPTSPSSKQDTLALR